MKNLFTTLVIVFAFINFANAQDWIWAEQGVTNGAIDVRSSYIDVNDNVYVYGYYTGIITISGIPLNAYGGTDIFLAKYNSAGVIQWAVRAGSAATEDPFGIVVDATENVFITGGFNGNCEFGEGLTTLVSGGAQDAYLAKYDATGALLWAKTIGTGGAGQRGNDIVIEGTDLVVVGMYKTDITFPLGLNLTTAGTKCLFIAKFDSNGDEIWAHGYSTNNNSNDFFSITKHTGTGYFIGGTLLGTITFDDLGPTVLTSNAASRDMLLVKVDLNGDLLWAQNKGNTTNDELFKIQADAAGNVYSTGYFTGTVDFGGTSLTATGQDFFISKRDANGNLTWVEQGGGATNDIGYGLFLNNNYIYQTGTFTGTATIGDNSLVSVGGQDGYIVVYDNAGNAINSHLLASVGAGNDIGKSIVVDSKANSYISGSFVSNPITINATSLNNADANADLFVAKYNWVSSISKTDVDCFGDATGTATVTPIGGTAAYNYLWDDPAAQTTQTAVGLLAGTYNVTIEDANFPASSTQVINSITITEPAALTLSFVVTNATDCSTDNDGAIDMTPAGGTAPRTQVWSNTDVTEDINSLSAGTYSVVVTDFNGCQANGSRVVRCTNTWNGGSADWNLPANWNGFVPTSSTNAIIPVSANDPIIDVNANCYLLEIDAGASLTIEPDASLIVSENATVDGDLTINSDNTGTGAFVNLGTITFAGVNTVNRYLSTSEYHLVSAPIPTANLTIFSSQTDFNNMLGYNENFGTADWMDGWDNTIAGAMTVSKGYAVKFNSSQTVQFIGDLNSGNQSIGVTNTNGAEVAAHEGWNLVGNPYPSPIDWDAATGWTKTNINDEIHCWDGTQYASYNNGSSTNGGSQFIPAMQGFMVKCSPVGVGTLSMNNNVRVVSTENFFRTTIEDELKLNITNGSFTDEMVVRFNENAVGEYDNFDAYKMFSNVSNVPQIYTLSDDDTELAINTYPALSLSRTVKVGFKVTSLGLNTIDIVQSSINPDYSVVIEDIQTGTSSNFSKKQNFIFYADELASTDRFLLHFTYVTSAENVDLNSDFNVFSANKIIYIDLKNNDLQNSKVEIYNLLGSVIYSKKIDNNFTTIDLSSEPNSSYFVKIINNSKVFSKKLIIE